MNNKYKIYLDMDGVICNYSEQFLKYSKGITVQRYEQIYGIEARYLLVRKNSPAFYANMTMMPDAELLLEYLKKFPVEILSYATDTEAAQGKLSWLKKHNINYNPILVDHRSEKALFANSDAILIDDDVRNTKEFIDAGGRSILHTSAENTISQLNQLIGVIQESKYRIYNSILNPNIWRRDKTIKIDIKNALIKIAQDFYKHTELEVPISDIYLLGSSAGYNWTPTSDLDLHILIDFSKIGNNDELVKAYTNLLRLKYNIEHDINIGDHDVEVYLQDINEKNYSDGVYSLMKNEWVKMPTYKIPTLDKSSIKKKYKELKNVIKNSIKNNTTSKLEKLVKKINDYRKSGLEKGGELSAENIVYKMLRTYGHIDRLKKYINKLKSKELSKL